MPDYPVMFKVKDLIQGRGFLAEVVLSGRAVMCQEDGKWWVYGVCPGAIAESGKTPEEAYSNFRTRYRLVLFDVAEESKTYDAFREGVEEFFSEDSIEHQRWDAAFRALRSRKVTPEPGFFSSIPQEDPNTRPPKVEVNRLTNEKEHNPANNLADCVALPAAA